MIKKIINLTTNLKREVKGILMKKKTIKVTMITIIEGEEEKEEEEDKEGQMNLNYQMIIQFRTYQKNLKTIIALKTSN